MRRRAAALLVGTLALSGCVSKEVQASARDVLTLRNGTISELRDRRGCGPFHVYDVPPAEMLEVAAAACRKAVGLRGRPVTNVEISTRYLEVTAKEHPPDAPADAGYGDDWRTAVVIIVHPILEAPGRSRVEWHAARRSPLLPAGVDWNGWLAYWIDLALIGAGHIRVVQLTRLVGPSTQ